jgi:large subunit ribosomal protein L6
MSRIGKKPIKIPSGVKVRQENSSITVEGPKGTLKREIPREIGVSVNSDEIAVNMLSTNRQTRSLFGLTRTLISNMITGVSVGFQKQLEISGVGYRAESDGKLLKLFVGFSTPLRYALPEGISIKIEKQVSLTVSGINKEQVGMVAADIRSLKKPEPYKGKGIRYATERVKRKVGKSAGA